MIVDDKSAGEAFRALGDLAESLATSVEAMTRVAIALQREKPEPSIYIADPVVAQRIFRTMYDVKD